MGTIYAREFFTLILKIYRAVRAVVPLPPSCRFLPSCSVYAEQAVQEYGLTQGIGLLIRRIIRCNPANPGGFDPVQKNFNLFNQKEL